MVLTIEATILPVDLEVITPTVATIEPEVPATDSFVEPTQPSTFTAVTEGAGEHSICC